MSKQTNEGPEQLYAQAEGEFARWEVLKEYYAGLRSAG